MSMEMSLSLRHNLNRGRRRRACMQENPTGFDFSTFQVMFCPLETEEISLGIADGVGESVRLC